MAFSGDNLLTIENLTKRYGDLRAVDDVSLSIPPGEIFALLGPNGAGKTTLINCVTGLLTSYSGKVQVAGYDVLNDSDITRHLIGVVPQELNYDAFFDVEKTLEFQEGYFGRERGSERVEYLLDAFDLADKTDQNTRWLSGGMKRRLMICKALIHEPALLFLDEPTAGVDVELREELWHFIEQLRRQGTTIVLTTHYIEEAEALADRIGILKEGRLLTVADKQELLNRFGARNIDIHLDRQPPASLLDALDEFAVEQPDSTTLKLIYQVPGDDGADSSIDDVFERILESSCSIQYIDSEQSSLEEIFREIIADEPQSKKDLASR